MTEPKAGDWVLYRSYGANAYPVVKVTPKLLKLGPGTGWGRAQVNRDDIAILGFASDKETALRLKRSLDSIEGEYRLREREANDVRQQALTQAREARRAAVEAVFERESVK